MLKLGQVFESSFLWWGLISTLVLGLTLVFWDYTQDDVFITYVYSRNLTEGQGFVFNPDERVQGTTTPLYTLLMAGVHLLSDDLLHTGNVLSAFFLLLAIGLAWELTRKELSIWAQGGFGLLLASSPLVYISFGMETLFYCFLLMLAFWLWGNDRRGAAMLAAAALTWTRADGVVLGGTFALLALFGGGLKPSPASVRRGLGLGAVYAAGIAPWYLFAWAYFGSPLPNTFGAKQNFLGGLRWWTDGWEWFLSFYRSNPFAMFGLVLVWLGLWRVLQNPRLAPLGLWAVFYAVGYTCLNVTAFWYYTPWVMILFLLVAFGAEWLVKARAERSFALAALLFLALAVGFSARRSVDFGQPPGRVNTYVVLGQWIAANTPTDSTLLVGDLGIMGYHARRWTVDSPGLISPQMYFQTDAYAVAKYKTDWVVGTGYYTWVQLTAEPWFNSLYIPQAAFSTAGDEFSPMTVYRRRYSLENPLSVIAGTDFALNCTLYLPENAPLPDETRLKISPIAQAPIAVRQAFLLGQYPEDSTPADEILREQILLTLPTTGSYTWELTCGDDITSGGLDILPPEQAKDYSEMGAEWGNFARLLGAAPLSDLNTWSGGAVEILLHWEAIGAAEKDYSLFLHVVDAAGQVVAQQDGYPRGEGVSQWQAGQRVVDVRQIHLGPDLPTGNYEIRLGWYDWETGERILTADAVDSILLPFSLANQFWGGTGLP